MTHRLGLTLTFALAAAASMAAQTQHPPSHPQAPPHGQSGHGPMDPAQHAALHALMHGNWHGTLNSAEGTTALDVSVATDKSGQLVVKASGDRGAKIGAARQAVIDGETLHWMQVVSGQSCSATANVVAAASASPETLRGTMSCGRRELTFALQKTTK